jgi:hypothetical protein
LEGARDAVAMLARPRPGGTHDRGAEGAQLPSDGLV